MLAVESPTSSPTMMGYSAQLTAFLLDGTSNKSRVSSFHHSDSSWDFDFDSFSDVPVYDEATEPTKPASTNRRTTTTTTTTTTSCYAEKLPWEKDTKKKKKKSDPEHDFNSSWPSARHMLAKANNNMTNKPNKSKKNPSKSKNNNNNKTDNNNNNNSLDSNSNHGPTSCAPCDPRPSSSSSKGVRFAPTKIVRTHTLVLGDHPVCADGLALELGWEYTESKDILKPLAHSNAGHNLPRWRRILRPTAPIETEGPARLLSLQERKKLLMEVAGCTEAELEKRAFCARFLANYDFHEPSPRRKQPPKRPSTPVNNKPKKSFTNMKNFSAGSSDNNNKTNNDNNSGRGSGTGRRDPPPTTSQQPQARTSSSNNNTETPIARPRRRSFNRRSPQPHYAARMA